MKCWICGKEMEKIDGCYHCKDCRVGVDHTAFIPPITQENESQIYQQGWVCPKCGGVYSPNQNYCPHCTPPIDIKVTYNTGDYVNPNINQSISVVDTGSTKIN